MKVLQTLSSQIFHTVVDGKKYRVDSVVEYLLDNDMNELKFELYEYIDLGETFELKRIGKKFYEFDAMSDNYIAEYTKGKMVKYTQEAIDHMVKKIVS